MQQFLGTGEVLRTSLNTRCRAYLSDWKDAEGTSHFIGRANIGAVSLNLPMIWMKAKKGNTNFFNCLSAYLEMVRKFLIKRYRAVANNQASHNPLAFTQGGLFGGYLQPEEKVGDMVKMFTASFGITALNELNVLVEGKPLHESDQKFINEVVSYIRREVDRFKEEDGYLYALYGVPAESLCGTQVQQFRAKYGVIDGVSDKEYFTNSFHMHVSANINPFTKQDKEWELFHKINGGHIGYGRMDVSKPNVVKGIVLRAMSLGYYYGVNAQKSFCDDCGETWHDSNTEVCPKCGSGNILTIDRVCGYIGYSKQKGHTRFNDAKLAEVKDRISM